VDSRGQGGGTSAGACSPGRAKRAMGTDPFAPCLEAARQEATTESGAALSEALPLGPGRLIRAERPAPEGHRWAPNG
jgi:hypothetical protein